MSKKLGWIVLILSCVGAEAFAQEQLFELSAEQWARPRQGEALVAYPSLRAAVTALDATPDAMLQIRYPGGEEGSLWAGELRDWLIALGVPASRIQVQPGTRKPEYIELVVDTGEGSLQ